jgi:hypothetical protein
VKLYVVPLPEQFRTLGKQLPETLKVVALTPITLVLNTTTTNIGFKSVELPVETGPETETTVKAGGAE